MTIGYILDDTLDKPDGVQQAMIAIAEAMRAKGHDVHYIVPYTARKDLQNVHSIARLISLKFNGNSIRTPIWTSNKRINQLFSDVTFDILHVQMPYSPIMAARVIQRVPKSVKIVGTFHILPYGRLARIGTRILGFVLHRSKRLISSAYAVSEPAKQFMEESFGLSGGVMANPVDYGFYHGYSVFADSNSQKIVYVGRFDERKGVKQLVRAINLIEHKDSLKVVMCGSGPLLNEIQTYAKEHELLIDFPGFVSEDEKARQLASATIAVFPSTGGESFGIVLTEAMSAGAGITIGGNNPGYASVLGPWPDTLFNPNNIQEFANLLQELLINPEKRYKIGKKQHESVKQYDIKIIVERLLREAYV